MRIELEKIKDKINDKNFISNGKECKCYNYDDKVIKLFHDSRISTFKLMDMEGLEKLSELSLKHFNTPIDFVYDNDKLVGYTENKLVINDYDKSDLDINYFLEMLKEIKEDILILSENGYKIDDLMYNYTFNKSNIKFFDLTSYEYINVKNEYVKKFFYKKNIESVNTFLVGLLFFDAFKHGSNNEYTKIFKSNEFIKEYLNDEYLGDYLCNDTNRLNL